MHDTTIESTLDYLRALSLTDGEVGKVMGKLQNAGLREGYIRHDTIRVARPGDPEQVAAYLISMSAPCEDEDDLTAEDMVVKVAPDRLLLVGYHSRE